MPSFDNVEEYLASVEEYFHSSLTAVTHSLPDVHEVVNQLWIDISRYGPGMPGFPEVTIPSLGDFQVPPPPPPQPTVPSNWVSQSTDWIGRHPWKASGIVFGVVGAGLLVGYRDTLLRRQNQKAFHVAKKAQSSTERRQIVVVLGGDTPYALPLIIDLEKKGYIVIASVSTPEAVDTLEASCQGYVKAHVLDPFEPATVPIFLRSLSASLSRKFPIKAAGDPYASPSSLPYIHSIISLLTLSAPVPAVNAPLEHISLRDTYLPYLTATQITPLQVIQALLPLLRTVSARSRDKGKKSIIVCLPATDARVGLPFASVQAMSAAATLRGVEILRREIRIASMTEKSDSMQNINVVVVDVGTFNTDLSSGSLPPEGIYKSMENWSASEKVVYGPAFIGVMGERPSPTSHLERIRSVFKQRYTYGLPRQPTDLSVFANNLIRVVSGGRYGPTLFGFGLGLGRFQNWILGERFSIGAGASTYKVASHLPTVLLDGLLSLPHFLISIRNRLLPTQPFRDPPTDLPPPVTAKQTKSVVSEVKEDKDASSDLEISSDADVESNTGDTVESSWVSLNKHTSEA
ncbi:hypothetical protein JR316_0003418 [Psilocybe cubensis]|uniref:DUF1776-domain-containing protein n=2 Tax=Psilocybe cubensis TaxID=181762 RepID=A0A8H8CNR6_PSICU|nr:hypothetical protein JR316_0003418 [Psilocybe cubensis]KAH9483940.1 hypothetical protein JR316_0003418 [Psilocybe cubensis]